MPIYTPLDAAAVIGGRDNPISLKTLSRWRSAGIGPDYIKVGGKIRYTTEAIERFLEKNTVKCGEVS